MLLAIWTGSCFIQNGYSVHKSIDEGNPPGPVSGENLSCTDTSQVSMSNLSYCWKFNPNLGTGNYQRLCRMFPKCMFDSRNFCITNSKTARSGSAVHRLAFMKFLAPFPQRIFRGRWMAIFSRVTPSVGGLDFSSMIFSTHLLSATLIKHIENIQFRKILWYSSFYSTPLQILAL